MSSVGTPGSALSGPGKRQISRAPSSSNGNIGSPPLGPAGLSPSLSRGGSMRVACGSPSCNTGGPVPVSSRTQSNASTGSSLDAAASSSGSQETQRPPHQHSSYLYNHGEERTNIDGYRFPIPTSPTSATSQLPPPPPPPTAESVATFHAAQARLPSQSQLQSHSNTPSISPSDSPSQNQDQDDSAGDAEYVAGDDAYELDAQAHHNDFLKVIERGLGVGSVKKKKSSNMLNNVSPSSSGPSLGAAAVPTAAVSLSQHANRASWCLGQPVPKDVDREVRTMEDAKGTIEKWRGRWGSMSMSGNGGVQDARTNSRTGSRAVAVEESEDEDSVARPNGAGAHQYEDVNGVSSESIPAGLVSAATPDTLSPQTPPQQVGSLENKNGDLNRSGSPTPKGKPRGITKMRETEEQRKKREGEELRREEETRERIRKELIKQEEKERMMLVAKEKNDGRKSTRSRSRSKLRKKGKGKK